MEDMVFGKFKIKKIKHEEIKKTLIEGFFQKGKMCWNFIYLTLMIIFQQKNT